MSKIIEQKLFNFPEIFQKLGLLYSMIKWPHINQEKKNKYTKI